MKEEFQSMRDEFSRPTEMNHQQIVQGQTGIVRNGSNPPKLNQQSLRGTGLLVSHIPNNRRNIHRLGNGYCANQPSRTAENVTTAQAAEQAMSCCNGLLLVLVLATAVVVVFLARRRV